MKFKYVQDSIDENNTDNLVTLSETLRALQHTINSEIKIDELKIRNRKGK